ncbi:hypothetical protein CGZ97_19755 [Enemella evansiae]|nr:hypothetical protein CGZ97_19755 [Enemella evansiae]
MEGRIFHDHSPGSLSTAPAPTAGCPQGAPCERTIPGQPPHGAGMDIHRLLAANHGIVSVHQLRQLGIGFPDSQDLVRRGVLSPVRRGWYRTPHWVDQRMLRAVTAGGALTCVSALDLHGLWTPPTAEVHCRRTTAITEPLPTGLIDCCPTGPRPLVQRSVDNLGMALRCAARCRSEEELIVLLDSALNLQRATRAELEQLLANEPRRVRRALSRLAPAESGTETMVRLRLRARRIEVRPQVRIGLIGRVDFLIGERLIIEVDSYEHHSRGAGYERDRERDQQLIALGYLVIRISYQQVLHRWHEPEAAILAAIRRGDHYWRSHRQQG